MNETNAVGNVTERGKSAGDHIVQKVEPPKPILQSKIGNSIGVPGRSLSNY